MCGCYFSMEQRALKTSRGAGQAEVLMSLQPLPLVVWPGPTCSPQQPVSPEVSALPLRASFPTACPRPPALAPAHPMQVALPLANTQCPQRAAGRAAASTPSFPPQQRWVVLLPAGSVGLPAFFLQQHPPKGRGSPHSHPLTRAKRVLRFSGPCGSLTWGPQITQHTLPTSRSFA